MTDNVSLIALLHEEMDATIHQASHTSDPGLTYVDGILKAIAIIRRHDSAPPAISGGETTSRRIDPADMAKNHLALELGNQKRFLYEYSYSQIVDILEQAGFLREPPLYIGTPQDAVRECAGND